MELKDKHRLVLDYLKEKLTSGLPPTVREICAATSIKSTSSVHSILCDLEEAGYIKRDAGYSRAIKIKGITQSSQVPILGKITAGRPILAEEQIEGYIPYPIERDEGQSLFALKVMGESMIGAGIMDGDVVVCEQSHIAENGDIVAALIDDEATVKRFYKEEKRIRLQAENPLFEPIILDEVSILGKLVALIRYF